MFTGLIEQTGTIAGVEPRGDALRLAVDPAGWHHRPAIGDSIAINGCCLTVADTFGPEDAPRWAFDVIPETLARTTLSAFSPGRRVHLEHAARADTLMGGHIVQGHVDGIGTVASVQTGDDWRLRVHAPAAVMDCSVAKGSIAVDGVSLTIADIDHDDPGESGGAGWLEVALIPVTLGKTALGDLAPGDPVNLEADVLAKAVVQHVQRLLPGLMARAQRDRHEG